MSQTMDLDEFLDTLPDTLEQIRTRNPDSGSHIRSTLSLIGQHRKSLTSMGSLSLVIGMLLSLAGMLDANPTDQVLVHRTIQLLRSGQLV